MVNPNTCIADNLSSGNFKCFVNDKGIGVHNNLVYRTNCRIRDKKPFKSEDQLFLSQCMSEYELTIEIKIKRNHVSITYLVNTLC